MKLMHKTDLAVSVMYIFQNVYTSVVWCAPLPWIVVTLCDGVTGDGYTNSSRDLGSISE